MNKVLLIIKREYITRVSNKRFLLMTFLMPLIFVAFIAGSAYFAATSREELSIAVIEKVIQEVFCSHFQKELIL
jgi:ABC-2 type transport system permease protein